MLEMWHFYVTPTVAYVPSVARTEAGFFLDVEPIEAIPRSDVGRIQNALKRAILLGNPRVPTPDRNTASIPRILDHAKVDSWSTFEKKASCWQIIRNKDQYVVQKMKRRPDRGWEEDPSSAEAFPPSISIDDFIGQTVMRAIGDSNPGQVRRETGKE